MNPTQEEFQGWFSRLTDFKQNRFHPLVWINGEPEIGENVYIGGLSEVNAKGARVVIGDHSDIASFVAINCADSHRKCIGLSDNVECRDITIEDHVFIGSHSVIKGGAHIGHHSVVAAGTIVDPCEAPPYSLIIGNPMVVKPGYYLPKLKEKSLIPHNLPTLGSEEQAAAIRVLQSNWVAQGSEVEAFENELCRFFNIPDGHAVAVSSGSAALYLALWALDGKKKRIGLPVYSCAALRNAVGMVDGTPVYLDCGEGSPNINIKDTDNTEIDILIAPSMFGIPVCVPETRNFKVIEDIAQSLGAMVSGERIGLQGEVGICSFYATKLITTGGQGGAVISKNKALIDKIRDYREFDCRDDSKLRFNFQMTDVQAAIGRVQLKRLPEFLKKREQLFQIYSTAGLELLKPSTPSHIPVRYRAVVRCSDPMALIKILCENGIRAIIPVEERELLEVSIQYPHSLALAHKTVSLPVYPSLQKEVVERIARIAKEYS